MERHFSKGRGDSMKRLSFAVAIVWLFLPAALAQFQQTTDVELIRGANRQLSAAIGARDINAMDKVWAHESYASFIGRSARWSWSAGTVCARPGNCGLASSIASPFPWMSRTS